MLDLMKVLGLYCGVLYMSIILMSLTPAGVNGADDKQINQAFTGSLDKLGIGSGKYRKFASLIAGIDPRVKKGFMEIDFSHITERDIRNLNTTVIEYIPGKVIHKMNITLLEPIIEKLLGANRPNAMGRVLTEADEKLRANFLLDKLSHAGGIREDNEEASGVLLYFAINKLAEKGGISSEDIRRLANDDLLMKINVEQLMKVKDSKSATYLLNTMYARPGANFEHLDDRALIYKLVEKGYGGAENWTMPTLLLVSPQFLTMMPSDFLKRISPSVISEAMGKWKYLKFSKPIQYKRITDAFMEHADLTFEDLQTTPTHKNQAKLMAALNNLGDLSAFVNPDLSDDPNFLNFIINSCNNLNLAAPMNAVKTVIIKKQESSRKKMHNFRYEDLKDLGTSVIKNGPPELVASAMKVNALSDRDLRDIGGVGRTIGQNNDEIDSSMNSFLKGIVAQLSSYAIKQFTRYGEVVNLPAAFLNGIGIKNMDRMDNRNLEDMIEKLRSNPDALDETEKAMLLKRLKVEGMLDSSDLPPEVRALLPRKKRDNISPKYILEGLPSDSEMRLVYAQRRKMTLNDLRIYPFLIGTLTPKQAKGFDLKDIPAVLNLIRKSKDGPPAQTLEALFKRYVEYIRDKSEDYDSEDKKLLRHITAAEISKLPATVLAYFIGIQTNKLQADVRKEIMVSLGELSRKDHATIPGKTREEILLQGLDALDSANYLDRDKKLDINELVVIGSAVVDLPADKIKRLTPAAVEQSLGLIQGTFDDNNDKIKMRACLRPDQKKAWRKKIIEIYNKPEKWDSATVQTICCSLGLLNEDDLRSIPKDSLANCRCVSDEKPPSHLVELKKSLEANCKYEMNGVEDSSKKTLDKIKAEIAVELDDLQSHGHTHLHGRKRKREEHIHQGDHHNLTCFALRIAGSALHFTKEQLETLNDNEIPNCLYELGLDPLGSEKSRVLWKKLTKSNGGIEHISSTDLKFAGFILSGITQGDVGKLNFSDPDIRAAFARPLGISKNVLEKMATTLESQLSKPLSRFDSSDLITTGNIICGFQTERMQDINSEAFIEALPILRNLHNSCEMTRLSALSSIALRPQVFGDPRNWTSADVRAIGILFNGLSPVSIQQIPPESFMGLTPSVTTAIPPVILSSLSPDQLSHISHFAAQAMNREQLDHLTSNARGSVEKIKKGPIATDFATIHIPSFKFTITSVVLMTFFAQIL